MKTTRLFLSVMSLGALLSGTALAEPPKPGAGSSSAAGAGKPESDHHSANQAPSPNTGHAPAGGVTLSDALAVESPPRSHGIQGWKKQLQTNQARVAKKQAEVLNTTKGKILPKAPLAGTPRNPASPWGMAKTAGPHDRVTTVSKDPNKPATPWGVSTTADPHDRVTTVSKDPNMPATPWNLPKTAGPHDTVISVSKEPTLELKPGKVENLPSGPTGLSADSALSTRTNNIDRQHSPGLVAIGGPKYPSLARNTVAINGTAMKHKP